MGEDAGASVKIADAGPGGWVAYAIATWMAWAFLCGFVNSKALLFIRLAPCFSQSQPLLWPTTRTGSSVEQA